MFEEDLHRRVAEARVTRGVAVPSAPIAPDLLAFGCLIADHACYEGDERCEPERMARVVSAFPQGFQLWTCDGVPVGYTGWYPMEPLLFDELRRTGAPAHRGQIVPAPDAPGTPVYIFNYSILPAFRPAGPMLRALTDELVRDGPRPLCALTVSGDGARVAARWGLRDHGGGLWLTDEGASPAAVTPRR